MKPFVLFVDLLYHTTHTTKAERRAEKQRQRRGDNGGQKTKRGIEGEDPAAAGIGRFVSSSKKSKKDIGPRRSRSRRGRRCPPPVEVVVVVVVAESIMPFDLLSGRRQSSRERTAPTIRPRHHTKP